jgi:hypothetical protein
MQESLSFFRFIYIDNQNIGTEYINKLCLLSQLREVGDIDASNYVSEVLERVKEEEIHKITSHEFEDFQYSHESSKTNIKLSIKSIKISETPNISQNNVLCLYNSKSHEIKLSFDLSADFKGTGIYELDGIANKYFPIRGNGNVSMEVKQLSGKMHLIAKFDGNKLVMNSLIIRFSIGSVKANFENLLDKDLSPMANVLLNSLAKPLIDKLFFDNKNEMENLMKRWEGSFDDTLSTESLEALMFSI